MVLNCCLFLSSPSMSAMMHVYGAADGGYCHLPLCVYSNTSLPTHIKPGHPQLSPAFKVRLCMVVPNAPQVEFHKWCILTYGGQYKL